MPSHATHWQSPRSRLVDVFAERPRFFDERSVLIEQRVEVKFLKALHRAQCTYTDVDGAIACGKHPPVSRNRRAVFVAQTQTCFQVPLGMARAWNIRTDCKAKGFVWVANRAKHFCSSPLGTRCQHHQRCSNLFSTHNDANRATVLDKWKRLALEAHFCTRSNRYIKQMIIKPIAWPHTTMIWKPVGCWPGQLALLLARDHAQTIDAMRDRMIYLQFV